MDSPERKTTQRSEEESKRELELFRSFKLKKKYHKVPDDVFNEINQLLLTVNCKLGIGIKIMTAFQKSEIIEE